MQCINENTIEDFMENKLGNIENERIIVHLTECDECFVNAMNVVNAERELIDSLTHSGGREADTMAEREVACLSIKLILGYAIGGLKKDENNYVDHHIRECNKCFMQLMNIQRRHLKESVLGLDLTKDSSKKNEKYVQDKAISHQNSLVIFMMEDIIRKKYEVVECTGKILKGHIHAEAAATRGDVKISKNNEKKIQKQIQKVFTDKGISLEVVISKGIAIQTFDIKFSMMGIGIAGVSKVHVEGSRLSKKAELDKNGEVKFENMPFGTFKFLFSNDILVDLAIF